MRITNKEKHMNVLRAVHNKIDGAIYTAFQSYHLHNLDEPNDNYEVLCVTNNKEKLTVLKTTSNITINKIGLKYFIKQFLNKSNIDYITPVYGYLSVGDLPENCLDFDINLKDYKLLANKYYKNLLLDTTTYENYDTIELYELVRLKLLLSDLAYGDKDINETWMTNENNIEYLIDIRNNRYTNFKDIAKFNYDMVLDYYKRAQKTLR